MITGRQLVDEYEKTIGQYTYKQRDCIGSIWKILEKYGAKADFVGANWFARHELKNMRPLTSRSQLYDGCAVLKTRLKGQSGYALPPAYESDADLIDYNHIGVGTDDGQILDSTRYTDSTGQYIRNGPGISTASIGPNSWDIIGDFEDVDNSDKEEPMQDLAVYTSPDGTVEVEPLVVTVPNGETARMRTKPENKALILANIRDGTIVGGIRRGDDGWYQIKYLGKIGWMMEKYLQIDGVAYTPANPIVAGDTGDITLILPRNVAIALKMALDRWYEISETRTEP